MAYIIILNPNSGKWRGSAFQQRLQLAVAHAKVPIEVWLWDDPKGLDQLMQKALDQKPSGIIAAGGDGTIHYVSQYLVGTNLPLGILPMGAGNAIANHLQITKSANGLVQMLENPNIVRADMGKVNGEPFLGFFGIGLDALVAHEFARGQKRDLAKYTRYAFRHFYYSKPEPLELNFGDKTVKCHPLMFSVMNFPEFGNHAIISPESDICDGELEAIWVSRFKTWRIPEVAIRVFTGSLHQFAEARVRSFRQLQVTRTAPGPAQINGEPIHTPREITIETLPEAISLLVPEHYVAAE